MLACETKFYNDIDSLENTNIFQFFSDIIDIYSKYIKKLDNLIEYNPISHLYEEKYTQAKKYIYSLIFAAMKMENHNNIISSLERELEEERKVCLSINQVTERYIFLKKMAFEINTLILKRD